MREKTYSTTVDQLDYGITALAVPIRGASGRTIAALNSSGYSGVLSADDLVAGRLQELRLSAGRIALTTYVPTDLLAQIDKIKEQRGVLGRAPIIEEALRFYIEAKQGT